ncbi:MAG: YkgJ family cysteine cluster protein [Campylobacteraceae bacterium]
MQLIKNNNYKFAFNPQACETCGGKCCTGESGYIWIDSFEIQKLAEYLHVNIEQFKIDYLRKVNFRYSLKEISFENGYACVFFNTQKRCCGVYEYRPNQCRTFPFWEHFKTNQDEVERECIGIVRL